MPIERWWQTSSSVRTVAAVHRHAMSVAIWSMPVAMCCVPAASTVTLRAVASSLQSLRAWGRDRCLRAHAQLSLPRVAIAPRPQYRGECGSHQCTVQSDITSRWRIRLQRWQEGEMPHTSNHRGHGRASARGHVEGRQRGGSTILQPSWCRPAARLPRSRDSTPMEPTRSMCPGDRRST